MYILALSFGFYRFCVYCDVLMRMEIVKQLYVKFCSCQKKKKKEKSEEGQHVVLLELPEAAECFQCPVFIVTKYF